jgi:hypothetical protein
MTRRIELPSKNWVEIREELKARDRFAVQDVASLEVAAEGGSSRASFLGMQNDMRNTLLGRIITAWSYPVPVPSQNSFQAADVVIGDAMDLDDYACLAKEIEPLMDKIAGRDLPDPKKQPSG